MDREVACSLLVFETTTPELVRVLEDARCSYLDGSGRWSITVSGVTASGVRAELGAFAERVLGEVARDAVTTLDLGAGREPGASAALSNPIELLEWCQGQPAALGMHPTVDGYLGASNPDFHLPFLPFHPSPGAGGRGSTRVAAVRVTARLSERDELLGLVLA